VRTETEKGAVDGKLTPLKGVLGIGPRVVGHLDARPARAGVLKEIDVRALVEAVVARRAGCRLGRVKVVHVGEPVGASFLVGAAPGEAGGGGRGGAGGEEREGRTYNVATSSSPGRAAMMGSLWGV
jgi:hypothetical protein